MEINFLATIITSLVTSVFCASDSSEDIQIDPAQKTTGKTADETLDVAENVVFRPYFQHPHSLHHHGTHHTHPHAQPQVVSLQSVNSGVDTKLQSNLIRRSYSSGGLYSGAYPNSVPQTWYATGMPANSYYYNPGPSHGSPYPSYSASSSEYKQNPPRKCYCLPSSEPILKPEVSSYNQDYYNKVASYYGGYNNGYPRT